MNTVLQVARLVAVLALVCVAAAIATPKGRLPLALRGLEKMLKGCKVEKLNSCKVEKSQDPSTVQPFNISTLQPSARKRAFAFTLVVLAIFLALI